MVKIKSQELLKFAHSSIKLHQIRYLVRLIVRIYTVLYLFTIEIVSHQVKLSMLYNVQTINLTFVGKI
jgi:hypothetical protein